METCYILPYSSKVNQVSLGIHLGFHFILAYLSGTCLIFRENTMHVLITGGAGFIGSHIAAYHVKKGDDVVVIDDLSTGRIKNIQPLTNKPNFRFYQKNLASWRGLKQALVGVDRVYHFAAVVGMFHVLNHPLETLKINLMSTFKLIKTIHELGTKPLILFASSSEIYGDQTGELDETSSLIINNTVTNHSVYTVSKLGLESIAMAFWHKHQLPCIILRIFNTIGRHQSSRYGMVLPRFIKQAKNNNDITVFGDGSQSRSFCNVSDTINLIELLSTNPLTVGEVVNVGNNLEITINDLAVKVKSLCKSKSSIIHVPFEKVYHNENLAIHRRRPGLTKLLSLTHYKYQWSLEKTILDLSQNIIEET